MCAKKVREKVIIEIEVLGEKVFVKRKYMLRI